MKTDRTILTVTDAAAGRLRHLLTGRRGGLRLTVRSRGCAGLSYEFALVDEPKTGDETVSGDGYAVYVDPMALMFVIGTSIDYEETMLKSGFVFQNPNEVSRCGCGESFTVDFEKHPS